MADINQFFKEYETYSSTFRETSFDDENSLYLCRDTTQKVINFDKIKDIKTNKVSTFTKFLNKKLEKSSLNC